MFNITPTTESLETQKLLEIDSISSTALENFIRESYNAWYIFWFDGDPVIKAELLGTKALEMFTKSAQAQAFIKLIKPEHEELGIPDGYIMNWNQDGSVVITKVVEE